jgi:hypothetical protein
MADLIGKFTNRLEDKPGDFRRKLLSASLAPAGAERQALEARRAELVRSLIPEPGEDADDVIYGIIAGGNTFGMSDREADAKVRIYAEALEKQPTWAINEARKRFGKGGWKCNWDGNGFPSSANVNAECAFLTLEIDAEIHKLSQILDAEIVDTTTTESERQDAIAAWNKLKADMGRSNVISERASDAVEAERAAYRRVNERFDAERVAASETQRKTEGVSHG